MLNLISTFTKPKNLFIMIFVLLICTFIYEHYFNRNIKVKEVKEITKEYEKPLEVIQDRIEQVEEIKKENKEIILKQGMSNEKLYNELMLKYDN